MKGEEAARILSYSSTAAAASWAFFVRTQFPRAAGSLPHDHAAHNAAASRFVPQLLSSPSFALYVEMACCFSCTVNVGSW
jgi:hypothetical protein